MLRNQPLTHGHIDDVMVIRAVDYALLKVVAVVVAVVFVFVGGDGAGAGAVVVGAGAAVLLVLLGQEASDNLDNMMMMVVRLIEMVYQQLERQHEVGVVVVAVQYEWCWCDDDDW